MNNPDKMKFETPDLTAENVTKIASLFPGVVVEGKVNIDLLRSMMGEDVFADEAYEFTWVGKRAAIAEAGRPIRKTLRPSLDESRDWSSTENLYIEGDNLDVLKLLQESYLGKIKMIYIDPPYNTGSDFIYRDDFTQSREEYEEEAGVFDEGGDRLFKNTEANGRFHSDWCSMIYPRLVLARNLLSNDGVIFITIDDNEIENLKEICNEVFGSANFVATIVWKHTQQSKNDERHFSRQYNYNLVYAKDKSLLPNFYFERTDEDNKNYSNPDNDPKGMWRNGDVRSPNYRKTLCYDIVAPNGNVINPPDNGWRWSEESIREKFATGEVIFKKDFSGIIRKIYLVDQPGRTPENLWVGDRFGTTRQATAVIKDLFDGVQVFDTPKPKELVKSMASIATDKNAIILDFFSGSATTAHAIMQLNAEDGGKRKFIMVQLPESCTEGTEAAKAGYSTICEIGKERIRRAGDKIKDEAGLTAQGLDIGFRVLKLADTNMNDVYYAAGDYTQDMILMLQSNIKEDRNDKDLLFGCLLDWGLPLSMPHTQEKIDGFTVHTYNGDNLIACFEEQISETAVREIASRKPLRAVFRDNGFASSPEKINVFEIFKLHAPNTSIKVI